MESSSQIIERATHLRDDWRMTTSKKKDIGVPINFPTRAQLSRTSDAHLTVSYAMLTMRITTTYSGTNFFGDPPGVTALPV